MAIGHVEARAKCRVVVWRVVGEYVGIGLAKDDVSRATVGCELDCRAVYGEYAMVWVRGGRWGGALELGGEV